MKFVCGSWHGRDVEKSHKREVTLAHEFITVPVFNRSRNIVTYECYVKTAYWWFQKPLIWYFAWQFAKDDELLAQALELFGS
jgi:hypothetical protein